VSLAKFRKKTKVNPARRISDVLKISIERFGTSGIEREATLSQIDSCQ